MSKKILILVGIPGFDYSNQMSAVAAFLKTIKSAFENEGHEVEFGGESNKEAVVFRPVDAKKGIKGKLKGALKQWPWLYQSLAFRNFFKGQNQIVDRLELKEPFDLIIEFHTVGSTVGRQLAKHWGAQFSVIFDSPVEEQFLEMHGTKTSHWSRILNSEKVTLEAADHIMAYSPACETHIRKKYKLKATIGVLPCVVNKTSVHNNPQQSEFNIGFIGSFLSWHKVDLLVKVFKKFHKKHENARLQLIGFGMEWGKVKALVDQLDLNALVEMPGFVSEAELLNYKMRCSVAIMPGSNWYGSPLKLFEYAQSHIPFIAPTTKTVVSIFQESDHCLFIDPENEAKSLLEKLTFSIENTLKMNEMADRAQAYVRENFEDAIYSKKLVEVLMTKP
ncbi:MAG: glycosyltransferase [Crocinitomix sp.]|nr:glycosyltransferase [Crocinitomix sp.]